MAAEDVEALRDFVHDITNTIEALRFELIQARNNAEVSRAYLYLTAMVVTGGYTDKHTYKDACDRYASWARYGSDYDGGAVIQIAQRFGFQVLR